MLPSCDCCTKSVIQLCEELRGFYLAGRGVQRVYIIIYLAGRFVQKVSLSWELCSEGVYNYIPSWEVCSEGIT